jgi:hypothetical protein
VAILRHRVPFIALFVAVQELGGEILKKLRDLLFLPFVFALIVVDRVLATA